MAINQKETVIIARHSRDFYFALILSVGVVVGLAISHHKIASEVHLPKSSNLCFFPVNERRIAADKPFALRRLS